MAEQLTQDIWSLILRHVPLASRLGRCALVSQKLHKAAAAATDALELAFYQGQEQRAEAFKGYLQQHGRHLTSLKLQQAMQQTLAQLPCARLLRLELSGGTVQLGPHNGLPGVLASCTGLTRLNISSCRVPTGLSGLSVLVNLRDLELVLSPYLLATVPGSVFSCMQHLTRLHLSGVVVEDVHHVSCLSSLAVLSISCAAPGRLRLAPDTAPGFVLPASLHDLCLSASFFNSDMELDPAVFAAAVQLTRLKLSRVTVVGQGDVSGGGGALLAAVSGLLQLDTLELAGLTVVWPQPSAAYQAFTASSRLQRLALYCRLPAGAFDFVFSPAAVCGELQSLELLDEMSARAVCALVRCCPRLQDLALGVDDAAAVAALMPLTGLTSLALEYDGSSVGDVAECVQGVAAITHLLDLRLFLRNDGDEPSIDRAVLLPLTALTQLTSFKCPRPFNWELTNQAGPGQPPDVWRQLRHFCLGDDTVAARFCLADNTMSPDGGA